MNIVLMQQICKTNNYNSRMEWAFDSLTPPHKSVGNGIFSAVLQKLLSAIKSCFLGLLKDSMDISLLVESIHFVVNFETKQWNS